MSAAKAAAPLTLATANIVHVTGAPTQREETVIAGDLVARLLETMDSATLDPETIANELEGLAQIIGEHVGDNKPWAYFVELSLQSIARRVEALREGFRADLYHVRAADNSARGEVPPSTTAAR